MFRPLFLVALITVSWLLYKLYFKKFWQQGRPGKIKLGLMVLGVLLVGLALTGRAPALLAVVGAAMTQIVRLAPLLMRFAPSLRSVLGAGARGAGQPGNAGGSRVSRVSTATIDMILDNTTGNIDGEVKQGEFAGTALSTLKVPQLQSLYSWCQQNDNEALRLLQTYLTRERSSEWRDTFNGDESQNSPHSSSATMNQSEARQILAVGESADREDIISAHRSLMGRLHPDKGGNDYLAAKINNAKSVLLDELKNKA